jgi:hypothetical protein
MNITKEFIPYTEALSLKELGFDEPCFGLYHNDKTFYPTQCKSHEQFHGQICSAPLYQQAFRWFREKYEWQHSIEPTADQHSHQLGYNYWIWTLPRFLRQFTHGNQKDPCLSKLYIVGFAIIY